MCTCTSSLFLQNQEFNFQVLLTEKENPTVSLMTAAELGGSR